MLLNLTPNLIYMIAVFTFIGVYSEIQTFFFATLTDSMSYMMNETLINHYGIQPTAASISILNSLVSTSGLIGVLFSVFFFLPISERRGRKFACVYLRFFIGIVSSLSFLGSAVFQATELFVIGQIINFAQVPVRLFLTVIYVAECTPDKHRGFASAALVVSDVIGQVILNTATSPSFLGQPTRWFVLPLFTSFLAILLLLLTFRLPESPKWLVRMNRMDEAKRALLFYHGPDCDLDGALNSFIREKNLTKENVISLREIYSDETLREALKLIVAVNTFMVFNTNSVEGIYGITINKAAGISTETTLMLNTVLLLLSVPARFAGTFLLDALGRRPVLFIGAALSFSKLVIMMIAQWISFVSGPTLIAKCMLITGKTLAELYTSVGLGALDTLLICELFPPSARSPIAQFLAMLGILTSFPSMAAYPVISSIFPPGFYFPFVILQPLLIAYIYKYLPETNNRQVCDIIESFDHEVASRHGTLTEENTPLIRGRARTFAHKRNSILNTSRTRALTYDH